MSTISAYYKSDLEPVPAVHNGAVFVSGLFHILVILVSIVGLPYIVKETPLMITPISVEIVDLAEMTTTNLVAPAAKEPKEEPKEAKMEPPPMVPPAPTNTAEVPPDLLTPKPPEIQEEPTPPEEAVEKPTMADVKPLKKPTPPKKKKLPKQQTQVKKDDQSIDSLLKNLLTSEDSSTDPDASEKTQTQQHSQVANLADKVTSSEADALKRQLGQCWIVQAGARNAEDLVVDVRVVMNADRTVREATILDQGRYNRDSHFRAAADSARRALRNPRCSPLKLPPEKYNQWKTIVITFDPREMLS